MKPLGLCFLFLSSVLVVDVSAQQQSNVLALNTDKAAIQNWLARGGQTKLPKTDSDLVILSADDSDRGTLLLGDPKPICVYMRTYRVKRETGRSDVTHPAGYTTCVQVARFVVKRAVEPKLEQSE